MVSAVREKKKTHIRPDHSTPAARRPIKNLTGQSFS